MTTLNFSELDAAQKRAVFWLAEAAETLTSTILAAVAHVGELWEAKAFLEYFPPSSQQYEGLANRLRQQSGATESILDCIGRLAPAYGTLAQRYEDELADMLAVLENVSARL